MKNCAAVDENEKMSPRTDLSRREFLLHTSAGTLIACCGIDLAAGRSHVDKRPNVVIVLTDDQGYGDLGCHGHPILKTPCLDRLHSQSVRLTDFHVAPVCSPTRGQLMTGVDALRNGARTVPAGLNLMWRDIPTMPEMFRAGGYRTGLFGKWHLGDVYPDRPMDRGFETAIWFSGWGVRSASEYNNDCMNIRYMENDQVVFSTKYCTDLWFDEAIQWMKECAGTRDPFLCYLATNAPHGPHWAKDSDVAPYREKFPGQAAFFGMINNIDDNVGKLMSWLDESGLADNTIVIFMTDNGGTIGLQMYNAGLRGGKGAYYEGGHAAACFIRWPGGGLGQPRDIDAPTQIQDILPTLVEYCKLRNSAQFDGLSLAQLLREPGAQLPDRMMVVQYGGRIRPTKFESCVIWGKWRMVGENELYNIARDHQQQSNVAPQFPAVLAKMREHYEQWWTNLQSRLYAFQPIIVGSRYANPTFLNCNMWEGVDVDNSHNVAQAKGGGRGGRYNILVERAGNYTVELRRWPFHTESALGSAGPDQTIWGRPMDVDPRKLPIAAGVLSIGGKEMTQEVSQTETGVVFRVELPAGQTSLQGWFRDAEGRDLCGAFYARVEMS